MFFKKREIAKKDLSEQRLELLHRLFDVYGIKPILDRDNSAGGPVTQFEYKLERLCLLAMIDYGIKPIVIAHAYALKVDEINAASHIHYYGFNNTEQAGAWINKLVHQLNDPELEHGAII